MSDEFKFEDFNVWIQIGFIGGLISAIVFMVGFIIGFLGV